MKKETKVVHGKGTGCPRTGAISTPIHQSATFKHPGFGESTGVDYSRTDNPTRKALEQTVAELENADHGVAFSSGMAALNAVISLFSPGDVILVSEDLYG